MALLCTLISTYQPGTTLKLYRKTWRNPIGKAEPALHHIAITGVTERLLVVDPKTKTQASYHITKEDIAATDWLVDGGKTPRIPEQQFYFYEKLKNALDRNRLITLNGWPEDRYLSANGTNGCFSVVNLINPTHNDWLATPNELMSIDWYMTERYAPINIADEMRTSYLDYAMSVIVSRALPDVRDGFKPVHRRVVYAMHELGNTSGKAYKKSARVVGDVIGKYHPHGDSAVYETIVRMAQDFSLRYPLVDGQGNFGSIDGDSAAAMRYTEIRMQPLTESMLADLEMDTVEWEANYDGTEQIPVALPTRFPNLVVNGGTGIAVGMATNMAPHNLTEAINATVALIQNPMLPDDLLLKLIPAPDFPTGGTIRGLKGSRDAILTGRGRIVITSKYHIETSNRGGNIIVFTEIPYTGNKAKIIMKIADLVKEKKLEGISNVQDESDREGLRIAIYCSRDANPDVVLNNLLNGNTDLETSFSVNNRVIVNGVPTVMNMRGLLNEFIAFRREVIIRRTKFQIAKARVRAHELEGLVVALLNIDQILNLIKASKDSASAKEALVKLRFKSKDIRSILGDYEATSVDTTYGFLAKGEFRLSEDQADKIIAMRLSNLTGLEKDRIKAEFFQILEQVVYFNTIINDTNVLNNVMIQELQATIPRGDKRRTMIDVNEHRAAAMEELIDDEEVVVTMSRQGWIKTQPLKEYSAQRRGGRGKSATALKEDDYVRLLMTTTKHQTIMLFTTHGRVHWVKVWELPEGSRGARGKPVQNFIQLNEGEEVTALLPVREFGDNDFVFMVSRQGQIKRVHLTDFSNVRSQGIIAMGLEGDDQVVGCQVTDGTMRVMLFSSDGKAIHFEETQVRAMGRSAKGVRGMTLPEGSQIVSLVVAPANGEVLCVCEKGYGKRTSVKEFTVRHRGGQGVIAINASPRNGNFVGAVAIKQSSEVMLCTDEGVVIRMDSQMITKASRNTQGVKLINVGEGAKVSAIEAIDFVDSGVEAVQPKVKKKTTKK